MILELAERLKNIFKDAPSFSLAFDGMSIYRDRSGRFIVNDVASGESKPLAELSFDEQNKVEQFLATLDTLSPIPIHSSPPPPEVLFSEAAGTDADIQQSEAYKALSE